MTAEEHADLSARHQRFMRFAIMASVLGLAGCPRTVYAPATELPSLAPRLVDASPIWPMVQTTSGDLHKIQGEITAIRIFHGEDRDTIAVPFSASIRNDQLLVREYGVPRKFPLNEKPYLQIDYNDRKAARVVGGIALFAVGTPLLIGGVAALIEAAEVRGSGGFDTLGAAFLGFVGVAGVAGGLGFCGGGLWFIATDASKSGPAYALMAPTLQVGPRSAGLTFKF